jgi:cystathionine beta-lyase/cystathionine gamma-synthase
MISPFDAFIALRGTKTLKLRVLKSAENALFVAKELEKHPKIENNQKSEENHRKIRGKS